MPVVCVAMTHAKVPDLGWMLCRAEQAGRRGLRQQIFARSSRSCSLIWQPPWTSWSMSGKQVGAFLFLNLFQ